MPEFIPNLHPLAVHFPIACLTLAALFHVVTLVTRNRICAVVAHITLWLGALGAIIAVLLGWQAFNSVHHDGPSHAAMLVHRAWALGTLGFVLLLAGWDFWRHRAEEIPRPWFVIGAVAAWGLVSITAWHGAELVYRHGLGVLALPAAETGPAQHTHDHLEPDPAPAEEPATPHHHAGEPGPHDH